MNYLIINILLTFLPVSFDLGFGAVLIGNSSSDVTSLFFFGEESVLGFL